MKIHYYDFVATGGVHTSFNAAMIEVLYTVFPQSEGIFLYCEENHGKIVLEKNQRSISFKPLKKLFAISKRRKIKDLLSVFVALKAVLSAKKDDVMCFGLVFPFCLNALWRFSKIFHKHIYVCLHGEMQNFLDNARKIYDLKTVKYMRRMSFAFKYYNPCISFIVLGQPIYDAIKFVFHEKNHVIVINHPALFPKASKKIALHTPIRIGHIGAALERKNSHAMFTLARLLEDEIRQGLVELKIIGFCPPNFDERDTGLVTYFSEKLDEETLIREINNLDFSVQLTTDNVCRAIASGTLIDSLMYDKPILGLHSSYLDYYFADSPLKKYIYDSVEELADGIKKILETGSNENYAIAVKELQRIKTQFSVEVNAALFREEKMWRNR